MRKIYITRHFEKEVKKASRFMSSKFNFIDKEYFIYYIVFRVAIKNRWQKINKIH